jgi:nitroreductase
MAINQKKNIKRERFVLNYYQKIIPSFILISVFWAQSSIWLNNRSFRPIYRQARKRIWIVAHKSAGLAAQNFMISIAAIEHDTVRWRIWFPKSEKPFNLPAAAEINMIIGCGIRDANGFTENVSSSFETIYFEEIINRLVKI